MKLRGNWSHKLDFIFSCVGFAVGLGNVWRFPYLCYSNGGGAFLIPYFIMLVVSGLPLFFMELALGQYAGLGPISVWKCVPLFKGIGCCMVMISFMVSIYYNVIIAYCIFYLVMSFSSTLPWSTCGNWWNTAQCKYTFEAMHNCTGSVLPIFYNSSSIYSVTASNFTCVGGVWLNNFHNDSMMINAIQVRTPTEEYFRFRVTQESEGLHDIGYPVWELAICLFGAWLLVFLCLIKGIHSIGKVAYVTALFPYVVLTAILIRGATLDGAIDGIYFFIVPRFSELLNVTVWKDAATQIFYSLGTCWGGLIAFSSYNKFHNQVQKDALLVSMINCGTSLYAGFAIFAILGFMAKDAGVDVDSVVDKGPGLAFIAYPDAVSRMPLPQLWSVLFFIMLLMLGLDSQFAIVETISTALVDEFPTLLRKRKTMFTLCLCIVSFVMGLPFVCHGGIYIFTILDSYSASFSLLLCAMTECCVLCYIYGFQRFQRNVEAMVGTFYGALYWRITWCYLAPFTLLAIFVSSCIFYSEPTVNGYSFPPSGIAIGWLCVLSSVLFIPGVALFKIVTFPGSDSLRQKIRKLVHPESDWGRSRHGVTD